MNFGRMRCERFNKIAHSALRESQIHGEFCPEKKTNNIAKTKEKKET